MDRGELYQHAMALYEFCEYPAVRYNILFSILDTPYQDTSLTELREEFLASDIVEEMYETQDECGGWGNFRSLYRKSKNTDFDDRDQPMPVYRINGSGQRYIIYGKRVSVLTASWNRARETV